MLNLLLGLLAVYSSSVLLLVVLFILDEILRDD